MTPCFVPRGGFLYDCGEGRVFAPFRSYSGDLFWVGGRGVVLDEIDTCIRNLNSLSISPQKSGFKSLPMRTFLGSGH